MGNVVSESNVMCTLSKLKDWNKEEGCVGRVLVVRDRTEDLRITGR